MRRRVFTVAASAAFVAASLALGQRPVLRGDEQLPLRVRSATAPISAADQYIGVGSCASPACHGGPATPQNDPRKGKWNSSYTIWVEKDKHAQAYHVLYDERSKMIANNLRLCREPYNEPRCLACHSTIAENSPDRRAIVGDGVGCESCHGPARSWLTEHYASNWKKDDPHMVPTRDFAVRAGVCVDCHVGSRGPKGPADRNMDHDMIAAGHPRLTFDFRAYLANMPPHWDEGKDRDDTKEESQAERLARVWVLGQLAQSEGSLRLLAARATLVKSISADARDRRAWPEFSEYDCYSCHHALLPSDNSQSDENSHRQRAANAAGHAEFTDGVRPGDYVWGSWHMPLTLLLLEEHPSGAEALRLVKTVNAEMTVRFPDRRKAATDADAAAVELQKLLHDSKAIGFQRLAERVLQATAKNPATDWDEACGQYLLLRSVRAPDNRLDDKRFDDLLNMLQFRDYRERQSGPTVRYNTPIEWLPKSQFDEAEHGELRVFNLREFNQEMDELRKLLPSQ